MPFTDEVTQAVWNKGRATNANDPNVWRKDQFDAWIMRNQYGNRDSNWGWEIYHINPDGWDNLSNLRPLHWKNNLATSEGKLRCIITAIGSENVDI